VAALREVAESWTPSGSPFAADSALSGDAIGALGALRGGEPGEYFSLGGLASPGSGRCGGCRSGWGSIERGAYQTMGLSTGQESGASLVGEAFSRRETRVPQIRSGVAQVRGDLSREVVRRVVRRNVSQVRACYEQQLISRPDLEGRVTVSFIISPTGATQTSVLASSSLGNSAAEQCIVRAVRRWSFPAPTGGGVVRVNYPFTLSRVSR
jgi:TonB family protein